MKNKTQETIDTMMRCFKNVLKWSTIKSTSSVDAHDASNIKEHLKNMYGIDICIWHFQNDCHVQYRLIDSENRHKIYVSVSFVKRVTSHLFKPNEYLYTPLTVEFNCHEDIFNSVEEELTHCLNIYFQENENRVQLLHTNHPIVGRKPLSELIEYTPVPPTVKVSPTHELVPDADVRDTVFVYCAQNKETKDVYHIVIDCVVDHRPLFPIVKHRHVHVNKIEPKTTLKEHDASTE